MENSKEVNWLQIHGLKCDKPGCGYKDDNITREMYPAYIDHPCPNCGASLLTPEDFKTVLRMEAIVRFCNKWFSWLRFFKTKPAIYKYDLDGTGKAKRTRIK